MQLHDSPLVCGAHLEDDGRCLWRVWAPKARNVELVLWEGPAGKGAPSRSLPMRPAGGGYFEAEQTSVADGQRYAYRLDGKQPRPDPASRWQPDGVHAPSAVWNPRRHAWADGGWRGVRAKELVIYELHVGTFTPEGTFSAIIPRLPALVELGITAIELMPVNQFPGHRDWGYDGVQWSAVQNTYGGPRELQRLVDACHQAGLAVLLDVVHNHLGPEGNYLPEFGPYFSVRFRTPWGEGINYDDGGSDAVRGHVLAGIRRWLRDFHVDGLRLDAVHAIHDISPRHLLADIKAAADEEAAKLPWPVHVIAESDLNDVRVLRPPADGGYGADAQWSDDFHHCVHCLLTGERDGYYADYPEPKTQLVKALNQTFVFDGCYSAFRDRRHGAPADGIGGERFVVSLQTHDQIGNRARGERLHKLISPPQQRLAAGLLLLAPHTPMLFMGEEYGETRPFLYFCDFGNPQLQDAIRQGRLREFAAFHWEPPIPDPNNPATFEKSKLSWSWPAGTPQAGLRRLYCDLLAARRKWPALREFQHRQARLWNDGRVLSLVRGDPTLPAEQLVAYFNLSASPQPVPQDNRPPHQLLRSEQERYAGSQAAGEELAPWEFIVFGSQPGAAR
jgi:maltooligosyltrehalose trehalohydrolase